MRSKLLPLFFAALLCSCATIFQKKSSEQHMPSLGDMGSYSKTLIATEFQKIGSPVLKEPIAVSATTVPFTKAKFKKYAALNEQMGQKPAITFVDSLPNKPKYVCLELTDRIAMQTALNSASNEEVLSYLEKGKDYRLVYKIAFMAMPEETTLLYNADAIFLLDDPNGNLNLKVIKGKTKQYLNIPKLTVFDYQVLGFCWGENTYGQNRIESLTDQGLKCPKNTERNAHELDETKNYLKL